MKQELYLIKDMEKPDKLELADIFRHIDDGFRCQTAGKSLAGKKIGVLSGSRGICNIKEIVKHVVCLLQAAGAEVVVLPAMGSHGGATAEGQKAVLADYGITEEYLGVPIVSGMKVEQVGNVNGHPVYVDKNAMTLDGVVPVNRVKAHTDFHGPHESGVVKMLTIGIGKRAQAEAVHRHGIRGLRELIPKVSAVVQKRIPLIAAVAIVENKFDETAIIEVLGADNIFAREQELLVLSKKLLPQIPFDNLDVLVVQEMGKNISGVGIDPNVTKRMRIEEVIDEPGGPKRIVALDLTKESGGNAVGLGIPDVITERLYNKVDFKKTYINTITSGFLERCFVPVKMPDDYQAVRVALKTCGRAVNWDSARIVFIKNTLSLSEMYISPALIKEIPTEYVVENTAVTEVFNSNGNLILSWAAAI
ncbi:lactate racemase domain-containing protein [Sporomusa sp. GT1]|uniref:lactate racemase domain-containing protein n=1 Tax=Sporomusa sp. GT1 TaxID=1534747 RepID=UPI001668578B|nr:lactate racemase domain-containing protein [Sporomusa sp. GT1]